jgi:hypothetical protein
MTLPHCYEYPWGGRQTDTPVGDGRDGTRTGEMVRSALNTYGGMESSYLSYLRHRVNQPTSQPAS